MDTVSNLNIRVIQQSDPLAISLLLVIPHVSGYQFDENSVIWSKSDLEGPLLIYSRGESSLHSKRTSVSKRPVSTLKSYGCVILNRVDLFPLIYLYYSDSSSHLSFPPHSFIIEPETLMRTESLLVFRALSTQGLSLDNEDHHKPGNVVGLWFPHEDQLKQVLSLWSSWETAGQPTSDLLSLFEKAFVHNKTD